MKRRQKHDKWHAGRRWSGAGRMSRVVCLLSLFFLIAVCSAGCIRLAGGAGYYKETPTEREEHVVGFDTAKLVQKDDAPGNVTV